jgi:hypothetical protein
MPAAIKQTEFSNGTQTLIQNRMITRKNKRKLRNARRAVESGRGESGFNYLSGQTAQPSPGGRKSAAEHLKISLYLMAYFCYGENRRTLLYLVLHFLLAS